MSKPANKTMIGAFVLIAVVLAVAAIVVLGSGKFFKQTTPWLAFFEGSVKGLNVGSPVMFRGVKVGEVTDIIVTINIAKLSVLIPVIFETDSKKFKDVGDRIVTSDEQLHKALIKKGLRAQLQIQSLVTGQLMIDLDFYPNTPAKLVGIDKIKTLTDAKSWWEIPTIPTPMQELEKAISQLDIKELAEDIKRAMDGLAKLASSPDLHESIGIFKQTLTDTQKLASNLNSKIEPLANSIEQTLAEARAGIGDVRKLVNEQGPPLAANIEKAAEAATNALDRANKTLKSMEIVANEGSQLRFEVSAALEEVAAAARSVRILADFIEQHPDALIRGRAPQTGEK
ncbi:MAG: MlaD family protein [Deltaproteobacteria bacterium]|jgi:paraquat-inducible protein B